MPEQVGSMVRKILGNDAYINFQDDEMVGPDPLFPEDDDECYD